MNLIGANLNKIQELHTLQHRSKIFRNGKKQMNE
jgi:hypothetical protein